MIYNIISLKKSICCHNLLAFLISEDCMIVKQQTTLFCTQVHTRTSLRHPSYDGVLLYFLRLQQHTGRFNSNLSHIFKSNTKSVLVSIYKQGSIVNMNFKYSAKSPLGWGGFKFENWWPWPNYMELHTRIIAVLL